MKSNHMGKRGRESLNGQTGGMELMPVVVRNVVIGEGMPKICAPIVGKTKKEILNEAKTLLSASADMAEWRVDWFEDALCIVEVMDALKGLREILKEVPLLFTFRTAAEGGEREIGQDAYTMLNQAAAESGDADLIDVELFMGDSVVSDVITAAHDRGVRIVASNHDFFRTPDREEMVRRLCRMQSLGADILKIAVMPQSPNDVLTLLSATEEMHRNYAKRPIVTMSMSGMGMISRLCGELFGSAVTFGSAAKASAPGQIGTEDLEKALLLFHEGLQSC